MFPHLVPMRSGWLNAAEPGIHEWDSVAWVGASGWFVVLTLTALIHGLSLFRVPVLGCSPEYSSMGLGNGLFCLEPGLVSKNALALLESTFFGGRICCLRESGIQDH